MFDHRRPGNSLVQYLRLRLLCAPSSGDADVVGEFRRFRTRTNSALLTAYTPKIGSIEKQHLDLGSKVESKVKSVKKTKGIRRQTWYYDDGCTKKWIKRITLNKSTNRIRAQYRRDVDSRHSELGYIKTKAAQSSRRKRIREGAGRTRLARGEAPDPDITVVAPRDDLIAREVKTCHSAPMTHERMRRFVVLAIPYL